MAASSALSIGRLVSFCRSELLLRRSALPGRASRLFFEVPGDTDSEPEMLLDELDGLCEGLLVAGAVAVATMGVLLLPPLPLRCSRFDSRPLLGRGGGTRCCSCSEARGGELLLPSSREAAAKAEAAAATLLDDEPAEMVALRGLALPGSVGSGLVGASRALMVMDEGVEVDRPAGPLRGGERERGEVETAPELMGRAVAAPDAPPVIGTGLLTVASAPLATLGRRTGDALFSPTTLGRRSGEAAPPAAVLALAAFGVMVALVGSERLGRRARLAPAGSAMLGRRCGSTTGAALVTMGEGVSSSRKSSRSSRSFCLAAVRPSALLLFSDCTPALTILSWGAARERQKGGVCEREVLSNLYRCVHC